MNIPKMLVREKSEIAETSPGRIRSTVMKLQTDLRDVRSLFLNGKNRANFLIEFFRKIGELSLAIS